MQGLHNTVVSSVPGLDIFSTSSEGEWARPCLINMETILVVYKHKKETEKKKEQLHFVGFLFFSTRLKSLEVQQIIIFDGQADLLGTGRKTKKESLPYYIVPKKATIFILLFKKMHIYWAHLKRWCERVK